MLHFGEASEGRLATVQEVLQKIARAALTKGIMDFSVTEGRRPQDLQEAYFVAGRSRVHWPKSKHNTLKPDGLAKAYDLVPFVNGKLSYNKMHCCVLAGVILATAKEFGIALRWGGNWDQDLEPITDQDFQDLVHFELVEE